MAWPEDARFLTHTAGGPVNAKTINECQDGLASAAGPYLFLSTLLPKSNAGGAVLWDFSLPDGAFKWIGGNNPVEAFFAIPIRSPNSKITAVDLKYYYSNKAAVSDVLYLEVYSVTHGISTPAAAQVVAGEESTTPSGAPAGPSWHVVSLSGLALKPTKDQTMIVTVGSLANVDSGSHDLYIAPPRVTLGWDSL